MLDKIEKDEKTQTENNKPRKDAFITSVFEWLDSFLVALITVVLIFTFFAGKVRVDGDSMQDTLIEDQQLIISDFNYTPTKGDIVIVSRNASNYVDISDDRDHQPIVKRIIATQGDTVEIKDGDVFVNDKKLDEPYIKDYNLHLGTSAVQFSGKQTVPEGRIFVLGDNREVSKDSRYLDVLFIDNRYVLGKVLFRIFPFDKMKTF